jgi:hypothetical protein
VVIVAGPSACDRTSPLAVDALPAVGAATGPPDGAARDGGAEVPPDGSPVHDAAGEAAGGDLVDGNAAPPGPVCASLPPPAPSTLGFSGPLPGASARVSQLGATRMDLAFDSGAALQFWWQGPPLGFAVGQMVGLQRVCASSLSFPCWDVIRGAGLLAAVWVETGHSAAPPKALPGAPTIALGSGCVYPTQSMCRLAPAVWASVFAVQADWRGSTTSIPAGTTGVVGPWQVTNVVAAAGPGSMTMTCIEDAGAMVAVTVLGPP